MFGEVSGTKIFRPVLELVGGEGDGEAEVPARGGDHAVLAHLGGQHPVEGPPGLERARVLQELELQDQLAGDAAERERTQLLRPGSGGRGP